MKELNKQEVLTQLDEFKKKNRQKYHMNHTMILSLLRKVWRSLILFVCN